MIYFTPTRREGQTLGTSYGVSLYVFVKGTEKVEPAIGNVSMSKREGIYYLAVSILNKGNVHIRPKVKAVVKVGKDFEESIEMPFGKPIFGGRNYTFFNNLSKQLPKTGICNIDVICNYGDSEDTIIKKSTSIDIDKIKETV